jgi:molybdopterin/thiamine biosynthesis adenylyltransferase
MDQQRYNRQVLLPEIGEAGQMRLREARVLVVGCGALGTVLAESLVRAGVGWLRIVDREASNLQRQTLFDESDAAAAVPKAAAAAERLRRINSQVTIDPLVLDLHGGNVESLLGEGDARVHLILDGTDNIETRYLLNDVAAKHRIPWIYAACVGMEGRVMLLEPGGPCLRCVFPNPPGPGELPTCDTAGVLGPAAGIAALLESAAAIRWIVERSSHRKLIILNAWSGRFREVDLSDARRPDCPCCGQGQFEFLDAPPAGQVSLCGANAIQIRPSGASVDLDQLAQKLRSAGRVERTRYLLRAALDGARPIMLTVFPDGRAIVAGTTDFATARSIYARWIGS